MLITKLYMLILNPILLKTKALLKVSKTTKYKMKIFKVTHKIMCMFLLTKPKVNTAKTDSILRVK